LEDATFTTPVPSTLNAAPSLPVPLNLAPTVKAGMLRVRLLVDPLG
jgi:hypothetical protein